MISEHVRVASISPSHCLPIVTSNTFIPSCMAEKLKNTLSVRGVECVGLLDSRLQVKGDKPSLESMIDLELAFLDYPVYLAKLMLCKMLANVSKSR